ncbi:hypothetical protein Vretifemale_7541, partial [Volvox reticuliferus]
KQYLGPFGWAETLRRDGGGGGGVDGGWQMPAEEVDGLAEYLERMGVDAGRAHQLAGTAPYAASGSGTGAGSGEALPLPMGFSATSVGSTGATATPLNNAATAATAASRSVRLKTSGGSGGVAEGPMAHCLEGVDVVFVLGDAGPRLPPALEAAVAGLPCPCYSLQLPSNNRLSQIRSAQALAAQLC